MDKNLYHPYVNKDGKLVSGAASLNHYIHTVKGSVQNYNDEIGAEYVSKFVEVYSDVINAGLAKKAKRTDSKLSNKIRFKGGVTGSSLIVYPIKFLLPPKLFGSDIFKHFSIDLLRMFFYPSFNK